MKTLIMAIGCLLALNTNAQDTKYFLYKGSIDGNMPVTLFLKAEYNGCTVEAFYQGMYQYDKKSKWLQVYPTENTKSQFALVEYGFSGIMILQKTGKNFSGIWISPDTKRQLKVELKEVALPAAEKDKLDKKLEEVNYENHDC